MKDRMASHIPQAGIAILVQYVSARAGRVITGALALMTISANVGSARASAATSSRLHCA